MEPHPLEIEEVMREPPLSADADVQAEVEQLVGCLSELYEGGGDALKRVRSQAAVEDDGSSCRPRGDGDDRRQLLLQVRDNYSCR
jgi:hypothetical protein